MPLFKQALDLIHSAYWWARFSYWILLVPAAIFVGAIVLAPVLGALCAHWNCHDYTPLSMLDSMLDSAKTPKSTRQLNNGQTVTQCQRNFDGTIGVADIPPDLEAKIKEVQNRLFDQAGVRADVFLHNGMEAFYTEAFNRIEMEDAPPYTCYNVQLLVMRDNINLPVFDEQSCDKCLTLDNVSLTVILVQETGGGNWQIVYAHAIDNQDRMLVFEWDMETSTYIFDNPYDDGHFDDALLDIPVINLANAALWGS